MQTSRHAPWAAAAVLMVASITALGAPASARAGVPDSQLLRTYQPVTHFDPQESFEEFLQQHGVRQSLGGQKATVVGPEHHMRQVGPRQQRHTPVRSAEREMMH